MTKIANKLNLSLQFLSVIFAILFISAFIVLAIIRSQYPFEIEIFEGNSLTQVIRLISGNNLYVPPTIEFVPNIYTPFYYYLSAVLAFVTGANFFTLRLVSFLATLGIFAIIYLFVYKETNNKNSGLIAVGLFAATYRLCNTWFDIARVDSLYNLFLILTIYVLRFSKNRNKLLISSALFALAYFTKQSVLLFILPLLLPFYLKDKMSAGKILLYSLAFIIGIHLIMEIIHGGWFFYYTWKLPLSNGFDEKLIWSFWSVGILRPLAIALCLIFIYFINDILNTKEHSKHIFHISIFLGLILLSFASRINASSNLNAMIPAYIGIALMFGIAINGLMIWWNKNLLHYSKLGNFYIHAFVIIQFSLLIYSFHEQIPSALDKSIGQRFIQSISKIEGSVWIPSHSYLSSLVGKKSYANQFSMYEVLRDLSQKPSQAGMDFFDSVKGALNHKLFDVVILDQPLIHLQADSQINYALLSLLDKNYNYISRILEGCPGFFPLLNSIRPTFLFVSKDKSQEYVYKLMRDLVLITSNQNKIDANTVVEGNIKRILAIAKGADKYSVLINTGNELATRGNLDWALQYWQQAIRLAPKRPEAYANLAVVMERSGRLEEALSNYQYAAQHLGAPWNEYYDYLQSQLNKNH